MMKINSAELMTQTDGIYKSDLVYSFIEDLDVDRDTAMKILDFIKDYANVFKQSQKEDQEYYEEKIDRLEAICDEASDRLREVASLLEPEEE